MSYTPKTWHTGDTVSASDLNHLEQGVADAGGGGILVITDTDGTLDKTWREISDAITAKKLCLIFMPLGPDDNNMNVVGSVFNDSEQYLVTAMSAEQYSTATENGYPVFVD